VCPLAGKSTLNRLEHVPSAASRYHWIGHDGATIERLLVDLFLEAHPIPPERTILDLDATNDYVLYEDVSCAWGQAENRIKERQLNLLADHTWAATMQANQFRLWFTSCRSMRCAGSRYTTIRFATVTAGTIRLKLLKIGAQVRPASAGSRSPWRRRARTTPSSTSPSSTCDAQPPSEPFGIATWRACRMTLPPCCPRS
jgi:Transposase DDE domain group 1